MHVQVFGPPDDRALKWDERTCDQEDRDQLVVFHLVSIVLTNGGWACLGCGFCTDDPDGSA